MSNKQMKSERMTTSLRQIIAQAVRGMSLSIPRLDALRAGINFYGATGFSVFSIFAPNENALSRVIVELFDPAGSHGGVRLAAVRLAVRRYHWASRASLSRRPLHLDELG
ncbi:hypothetical protein [Mesorhizobium cantuariense]|uniref:Uncharacterized protein n=1 Tax=Mesorhizobium cantuariense TaxID=1300275 RepID=A0ABV7MVU9_9HYPH